MQPFPQPLDEAPFSVARAAELGVPVTRLRRRSHLAPFPGVRVPKHLEPTFELRCRAFAERMAAGHHFSHLTAARLWGVWLPRLPAADEPLHVTAVLPRRAPRLPGVSGHHVGAEQPASTVIRGLRVATPTETLRGLAAVLHLGDLVVACDSLTRRQNPLLTRRALEAAAADFHGRGAKLLRRAVALSRPGADSPRETRVRLLVVRAGLPEPEVNGVISRPGASSMRYGDLVFREWRVVAEYEGVHHSEDRATYTADIARYEELAEWTFVKITKEHFADPPDIIRRITAALRSAGWCN